VKLAEWPTNIRLVWKRLGLANTLAYYGTEIMVFEEEALGESSWSDFVSAFFLFLIPLDFLQVILNNPCSFKYHLHARFRRSIVRCVFFTFLNDENELESNAFS
jgi:hypothetical protein